MGTMVQSRRNLPMHGLRAFEAAARHLHVATAAEELGVTHSAVSHQIRTLEDQLGTALFNRSHKPFRLTPEGEQLLHRVGAAFDSLCDATTKVRTGDLEGDLSVSCVPGLGANWLVPLLGQFLDAFPKLRVKVLTEHWRDPSASGKADLAIVYGSAEHPGRRVVHLGHSDFFPVCSPRLLGSKEPIRRPADLRNFNLLHEYDEDAWSQWFATAGVEQLTDVRGIFFDSAHCRCRFTRRSARAAIRHCNPRDPPLLLVDARHEPNDPTDARIGKLGRFRLPEIQARLRHRLTNFSALYGSLNE
jgi:LysR family transcriptional regulator, glycine cleavage system transcriptional activator